MIRKDVTIAILATFCLTTTLFLVLPTRSSSSAGGYDSWADINEDGRIDMKDLAYVAKQFGTSGDSTKDVNVTNWEVDCYHRYSMEIVIDEGNASLGNAEPVTCIVHVSYQGLPVRGLSVDNFHRCTISSPLGSHPVGFQIVFVESYACDGCYKIQCLPYSPQVWAKGTYAFYIGVWNPPPPSSPQVYNGVMMTSFAF